MAAKIYRVAQERILEIWDYTERTWGEDQADAYVRDLIAAADAAESGRHRWRPVLDPELPGVFFIRYRHHLIFFRELSTAGVGVISVLHESMDLPGRLKEDAARGSERPAD